MKVPGHLTKVFGYAAALCLTVMAPSVMAASTIGGFWVGTYTGTYGGPDQGTVSITINEDGTGSCHFHSYSTQQDHDLTGGFPTGISNGGTPPFNCSPADADPDPWSATAESGGGIILDPPPPPPTTITGTWWRTDDTEYEGTFTVVLDGSTPADVEALTTAPQSITGAWYDPAYEGSGFNMLMMPGGLLIYYYGWDGDGNRLWLMSEIGPGMIIPNEVYPLAMSQTNGGTFLAPAPSSSFETWGTLQIYFSTCNSAKAELYDKDGNTSQSVELDLQKISGAMGAVPGC